MSELRYILYIWYTASRSELLAPTSIMRLAPSGQVGLFFYWACGSSSAGVLLSQAQQHGSFVFHSLFRPRVSHFIAAYFYSLSSSSSSILRRFFVVVVVVDTTPFPGFPSV